MPQFPETRKSLLVRIRGPHDEEAWGEFVTIYRPVCIGLRTGEGFSMRTRRIWPSE